MVPEGYDQVRHRGLPKLEDGVPFPLMQGGKDFGAVCRAVLAIYREIDDYSVFG
jgi:hypothetical protein